MSLYIDIHKELGKFSLDVSFEAECGVTGLLGPSGGGKSMTLKCIAGIEKPDSGRIVLNGITLFDSKLRINLTPQERKVGYLFQHYALFPTMNTSQNILCGIHDKSREDKERRLAEILDTMQLRGFEKHKPHQLSGGQQQRVALARIMIGNPDLLMLDEPFSALDSHLRTKLQIQMQNLLIQFGKDALMVTHDKDEAYLLCDSIALIDNGKIVVHDAAKELFSNPGTRRAAELAGCKNIIGARRVSANEVEIPSWGVRFTVAQPLPDDVKAVGVFAYYFNPKSEHNCFPVHITRTMEESFEYILQFRYESQDDDSPDLLWRTPKYRKGARKPAKLGIDPENILPLFD